MQYLAQHVAMPVGGLCVDLGVVFWCSFFCCLFLVLFTGILFFGFIPTGVLDCFFGQ